MKTFLVFKQNGEISEEKVNSRVFESENFSEFKHFNFKDNLLSPIVEPAEYNDIAYAIAKSNLLLNPWFASPLIGTKDEMCKNLPHYLSIIKKSLINIKNE